MGKPVAALLAAALLIVPAALAEESTVYEAESAQLPEDFSEKLGELAQQLDDIDNMENTEN